MHNSFFSVYTWFTKLNNIWGLDKKFLAYKFLIKIRDIGVKTQFLKYM